MENHITVVVSHFVKKGIEQAFEAALKEVIEKAKSFQGYEGIQTMQVNGKGENEYILLVRFDSESSYQVWKHSATRKAWSVELKSFITRESEVCYQEGLEFWFSIPQVTTTEPPKKWKMAILTWMVIYPLVLTLSSLAGFFLDFFPLFLRMLLVSMVMVTLMTYLVMPKITVLFAPWIFKKQVKMVS
ncbi:MAG: antibiotic biosynthesis monooxygenase [Cytophagales bacterium]|nr:antibiotic biosynthesis monooxygenase [Cytophagales bacterium]